MTHEKQEHSQEEETKQRKDSHLRLTPSAVNMNSDRVCGVILTDRYDNKRLHVQAHILLTIATDEEAPPDPQQADLPPVQPHPPLLHHYH